MSDTIRCPGCGQENAADQARCERCGHPLRAPGPGPEGPPAGPGAAPAAEPVLVLRRPVRRPRPRPMAQGTLWLWALAGFAVVATLVYYFHTDLHRRAAPAIEGASAAQLRAADSLGRVIERDSTDVEALVAYGNLLYDTANWAQAARYYGRALARDSGRVQVLVDLGVCWYNLGDGLRAQQALRLALRRDPANAVALYNLGIIHERAGDDAAALRYFHQSLAAGATGPVAPAAVQHLQGIQQRTGRPAPPFGVTGRAPADGTPGSSPGGPPPAAPSGR